MNEPIIVVEYDPNWILKFNKEKENLMQALGILAIQIEHIGSTAIEGLIAKPIIDILIGVECLLHANQCIPLLENLDYQYIPEHEKEIPERRFFRKPPKSTLKREFHIHLVVFNSSLWKQHIYFRDYLSTHIEALTAYAKLKKELAQIYINDRRSYTNAKSDFISKILATSNVIFDDKI